MKFLTTILKVFIFILLVQKLSFSQQTDSLLHNSKLVPYAKLYLHTDREFYFRGDTIWFKAYYLDGQSQQFVPGYYNLHTDLLDENGVKIYSQVLPVSNGVSSGYMPIPAAIVQGNYILRALTDFQKIYGEDAFFYKTLNISEVKSSLELDQQAAPNIGPQGANLDVAFLPEGGILLAGQQNVVGVKVLDETGRGVSIRGVVVNSKNQVVTFFATEYKGMGKFAFTPQLGETYHAKIQGDTAFSYQFKDVINEGIKLGMIRGSNNEMVFKIASNSGLFEGKKYFFTIMYRGNVLLHQEFFQNGPITQIKVNPDLLPAGINQAVLLDDQLRPVSERLFFSLNFNLNEIQINLNQDEYETRSEVQFEIMDADSNSNSNSNHLFSSLSIAVVDENAIRVNGPSMNMQSWLLIESELKGNIESPADFFLDEETISSENKLNLLMLTQGWSRYLWNTIAENEIASDYKISQGITIKGRVKRLFWNKPIVNGDIVLGIFQDGRMDAYDSRTDSSGKFSIDGIVFTEEASAFIQARNSKGRLTTELFLDPIFEESPGISGFKLRATKLFTDLPLKLYRQKYFSELAMKEFSPEVGAILLEEVNVKGLKIEKEKASISSYRQPETSLMLSQTDESYPDMFTYLKSKVPGLHIVTDAEGTEITIRGPGSLLFPSTPLLLLNDVQVGTKFLETLPMTIIDRVNVYISANETAWFGMRGSNGVIAIYTKHGVDQNFRDRGAYGAIAATIKGYAAYREFYNPHYTTENIYSSRPDNRITLYWNPNVIIENDKAELSFFTSDDIANYKVFVEGMTNDGRVCLGETKFSVSERNAILGK